MDHDTVTILSEKIRRAGKNEISVLKKMRSKKIRIRSLANMPQVISNLSMSIRSSPSLEAGLRFTAENTGGPMAESLRRLQWDVHMRNHTMLETAFRKFAEDCGRWNENFKRSLYLLYASLSEPDPSVRRRTLEKANAVITAGVKHDIVNYANSLKGPTMLLFAFGIVLPIIIVTMLPMIGSGMNSLWWIVLLMNVLLPLICFFYIEHVLSSKPNFSFNTLPGPSNTVKTDRRYGHGHLHHVIPLLIISSIIMLGLGIFIGVVGGMEARLGSIILILTFGCAPAYFLYSSVRPRLKLYGQLKKMEAEFPDALYQLGLRIGAGVPLERALEGTGAAMKDAEISKLFTQLIWYSNISRTTISNMIKQGDNEYLDIPLYMRSTMGIVVSSVEKVGFGAGEIVIDISNYIRDLRSLEEKLRQKMKEVLDTIYQTGTVFAPLIIGLTASMYFKLNQNLSGLDDDLSFGIFNPGNSEPIPAEIFILIFGAYLLIMIWIIVYFVSAMDSSGDKILFRTKLSKSLVTGSMIYCLSSLVGLQLFG